jgi:predicted kinase
MLVGVPGSGKSTWIKDQVWALGLSVVSTDPWVEDYARSQGKTYSEVFEEYMPIAVRLMTNHALTAQANHNDIIWDQTSTTRASRACKFRMLPEYSAIAVVFRTPEPEELARRLASRPGKTIPPEVIARMIEEVETGAKPEPLYKFGQSQSLTQPHDQHAHSSSAKQLFHSVQLQMYWA